ncbi:MAG: hypothetical protein ACI9TY_001059 [Alphaproteobacteria bacterium]|jgi:hypothetical protein
MINEQLNVSDILHARKMRTLRNNRYKNQASKLCYLIRDELNRQIKNMYQRAEHDDTFEIKFLATFDEKSEEDKLAHSLEGYVNTPEFKDLILEYRKRDFQFHSEMSYKNWTDTCDGHGPETDYYSAYFKVKLEFNAS